MISYFLIIFLILLSPVTEVIAQNCNLRCPVGGTACRVACQQKAFEAAQQENAIESAMKEAQGKQQAEQAAQQAAEEKFMEEFTEGVAFGEDAKRARGECDENYKNCKPSKKMVAQNVTDLAKKHQLDVIFDPNQAEAKVDKGDKSVQQNLFAETKPKTYVERLKKEDGEFLPDPKGWKTKTIKHSATGKFKPVP